MELNLNKAFSKSKILVIGDIMLDHYVRGTVSRFSPEAPVPVLLKESEHYYLGGAGNVFSNIHSLGGNADILSIIGDDTNAEIVRNMVSEKSTLSVLIETPNRKTTTKSRYIGNSHHLLRVDHEDYHDIDTDTESTLIGKIESIVQFYDCVVIEDYNKGLLTPNLIVSIVELCNSKRVRVIVDPKIKNVECYSGCTTIKPNLSEFCNLINKKISASDTDQLVHEARSFLEKLNIESILITLSENGILYVTRYESYHSPGYPIEVSDVSGAGDTVTAMFALCLSSGIDTKETLKLCNIAGSVACSHIGAASVNVLDITESKYF